MHTLELVGQIHILPTLTPGEKLSTENLQNILQLAFLCALLGADCHPVWQRFDVLSVVLLRSESPCMWHAGWVVPNIANNPNAFISMNCWSPEYDGTTTVQKPVTPQPTMNITMLAQFVRIRCHLYRVHHLLSHGMCQLYHLEIWHQPRHSIIAAVFRLAIKETQCIIGLAL